ncbi:hypothetical protein [Methylibium sp.]|uniref:hypothetical protein n=1 Tax=Methylibium sp. TaxID=2067992 RepID=UPI003D0B4B1A
MSTVSETINMTTTIIHLALDLDGMVLAHFLKSEDCARFCQGPSGVSYTHLPYNVANRDGEPAPLVGSTYRA